MAKNQTYQIDIDGYIGNYYYSKQYIRRVLEENKNNQVRVRMNSLGGSLDHGLDISDRFFTHGNVEVDMFGFNASAATIATLGAKKVRISSSGFYLIHKVMNWIDIWGSKNADEIAEIIQDLEKNKKENDKIDLVIAQKYSIRTGKSIQDMAELMQVGGWMTAQEAFDWGFVDEIIPAGEKMNMKAMYEKLNAFGLPTNTIGKQNFFINNSNNSKPMKKQFIKVNAAIGVEQLESTSDGVFLNETQIEAIENTIGKLENEVAAEKQNISKEKNRADEAENKLNTANNTISQKDTEIQNLKTQIENLKKGAGETTNDVKKDNDGSSSNKKDDLFAVITTAREMFNGLPD